jgi:hypothetical protein
MIRHSIQDELRCECDGDQTDQVFDDRETSLGS